MKQIHKMTFVFIVGLLLGLGYAWADSNKPTDVRVGPTAAIGVATSCDGKIVFVAHGNGIFRSSDSGATWDKVY
jgi:hypothetical protein